MNCPRERVIDFNESSFANAATKSQGRNKLTFSIYWLQTGRRKLAHWPDQHDIGTLF